MIIDVVLDSDITKTISLYEGEEPEEVAKLFAKKHSNKCLFNFLFLLVLGFFKFYFKKT